MAENQADELLVQLHEVNIPLLFDAALEAGDRKDALKLTKQKLKRVKKSLKQEMDTTKARWDGRNAYQAQQERLHLAPLLALDTFIDRIEIALSELEIKGLPSNLPPYRERSSL